ncbi:hypothetical protein GCM10027589_44330 [Actinocorallia lasiicapitis]
MHRPVLTFAAVALALTACSGGPAPLPKVEGRPGTPPVITIPDGKPDPKVRVRVLDRGTGPRTTKDQAVIAHVDMRTWSDRKPYLSSWSAQQPTTVRFDGDKIGKAWETALVGRSPGARILLVTPARFGMGGGGRAPGQVDPGDTMVEVFDVIGGYPVDGQVTGAEQRPDPATFPQVKVEAGKEPAVTVGARRAPRELAVATLVQGTGAPIRAGSTFVTNYTAARWKAGDTYDSSYRRGGPNGFVLGPKSVPPGWERALDGVRAGSRVEIIVPKRLGKGFGTTLGGLGVPPGETIVYVMDILDVRDPSAG